MNLVLLFLFYREEDAMFLKRILNLIIEASLLLVML